MTIRLLTIIAALTTSALLSHAQGEAPAPEASNVEATHDELRALREKLVKGILEQDVDLVSAHVHDDVLVTWQHGTTQRGKDALAAFMKENNSGASRVFKGYKQEPTASAPTTLYGENFGVCQGTSVASYSLLGKDFELENHWTVTLVKDEGTWKLASYHVSANTMDNPFIQAAKDSVMLFGIGGLVVGLAGGLLLARICCCKKSAAGGSSDGEA
jgi:ketosteroid isomerase-like protein